MKSFAIILFLGIVVSLVVERSQGQNLRWGKREFTSEYQTLLRRAYLEGKYASEHRNASKCCYKDKVVEGINTRISSSSSMVKPRTADDHVFLDTFFLDKFYLLVYDIN